MVKFVVCFRHPASPEGFENVFQDFLALVERMPGIQRRQVMHVVGAPQGRAHYGRVLELYFADQPALEQALLSPQGQEAGRELGRFDAGSLEVFFGHVFEA